MQQGFTLGRAIFPVFVLGLAVPAFAGLTYTCNINVDAIQPGTCAYLNNVIATIYDNTFGNANANIYIQYGQTNLGASETFDNLVPYGAYLNALAASAQASGNAAQADAVKALNSLDTSLYGGSTVELTSPLANALGIASEVVGGNKGITGPNGSACNSPGTTSCYDGVITVTAETGVLFYRNGTEAPNQYDFFSVVEHETDEVLGTASCIETTGASLADPCPGVNTPAAVDLYRYQSPGNLVLIGTTPGAYFSFNGGQTNGADGNVYNTLSNNNDYADFISNTPCQYAQSVQDGTGCPGFDAGLDITNDGGAEINILNTVGFKLNVTPAITNVLNGATGQPTLAASTYVAIYGTSLSTNNPGRVWTAADFTANSNQTLNMPTSLDGTSVTVNGTPAYVYYVSPTQLNIITPPITATGINIPVIVTVNGHSSATFLITLKSLAPSFFTWSPPNLNAGKFLIAEHANGTYVGKPGLFPNAPANFTTPAVPGETIVLYGTGFGPTSPPIAPGIETDQIYNLIPMPNASFFGMAATVRFAGLIPGLSQVYQFDVVVPATASSGDLPFVVNVNGTDSYQGAITVLAPSLF